MEIYPMTLFGEYATCTISYIAVGEMVKSLRTSEYDDLLETHNSLGRTIEDLIEQNQPVSDEQYIMFVATNQQIQWILYLKSLEM